MDQTSDRPFRRSNLISHPRSKHMEDYETILPDSFAYGGRAAGSLPSGKRCFIRGGVPGDLLKVRLLKNKKNYAEASIESVEKPSPERIQPACPYAAQCPGCSYLQTPYANELKWKQKQFLWFMKHSGCVPEEIIRPPVPAASRTGWRNKIRLTARRSGDRTAIGYLAEDNVTVLDIRNCILARPEIYEVMTKLLSDPGFRNRIPEGISHITFRFTEHDGVLISENSSGDVMLTDSVPGFGDFAVPLDSFFQINTEMTSLLCRAVSRIISELKPEHFIELYCGCGLFSAVAAQCGVRKIHGVELNRKSIEAARTNLGKRGLPRAKFLAGDALRMLGQLPIASGKERKLILIDPPRTGLDRRVIAALGKSSAEHLIYVSCGPDTLARDLALFAEDGWKAAETGLFDLFPGTAHFETLTLLERKDGGVNP